MESDVEGALSVTHLWYQYQNEITFISQSLIFPASVLNHSEQVMTLKQDLSQDLETDYAKLAIVNFLGINFFKGYQDIFSF